MYAYLRGYPDLIDVQRITSLRIHSTDEPDTAVHPLAFLKALGGESF
ncbi:hypothetical protein ACFZDK_31920 [Streptomyces sp. NPDC007901]